MSGRSAFDGKEFKEILEQNKASKIDYNVPALKRVPASTLDLLKKMLSVDPKTRIGANEALKHVYFQGMSPGKAKIEEDEEIGMGLQEYNNKYQSIHSFP